MREGEHRKVHAALFSFCKYQYSQSWLFSEVRIVVPLDVCRVKGWSLCWKEDEQDIRLLVMFVLFLDLRTS